MFCSRKWVFAALVILALGASAPAAPPGDETKSPPAPVKIGILPFDDATGESAGAGEGLVKWIRAEMARDKRMLPKVLAVPEGSETMDREKAAAAGKQAAVDAVLMGTILEANVDVSQSGANTSGILGQLGVGGGVSSAKAEIVLQGELISVATGEAIMTERITGKKTESKLRGDVQTELGSMDFGGEEAQNSPLGKALKEAVGKLVQAVAQKLPKITPAAAGKKSAEKESSKP